MSANPLTPHPPRPALLPGQQVHVNTHAAAWVPATVVSVAHTKVGIALATTGLTTLRRLVAPWLVAPADGLRLAPIGMVREGDQVAAPDGTRHTVARPPWQGGDGWWMLTYTDGKRATLAPGSVLRLTDPTTGDAPTLG